MAASDLASVVAAFPATSLTKPAETSNLSADPAAANFVVPSSADLAVDVSVIVSVVS